jgi:2-polyprenyl-3-methyl-5-hydroxy-6-metoxy-1,4-benzoquinol methylase
MVEFMEKDYFVLGNAYKSVLGKKKINNEYKMESVDLSNDNDSHSLIVNHIIKNKRNKTILDVGANTGVLGNTLVEYNSVVDGIEYCKDFYKKLKTNKAYRNTYNLDITDFSSNFYNNSDKYDYIIFADVLEHLCNPEDVLLNISKKLNKKGKIIISIPNIAHLDVIIQLINGNFNYNDEGILDSTHLRFFTHESFIDMIENIENKSGLYFDIAKIGETKVLPPYANAIDTSLFNMFDNLYDFSVVQNLSEISLIN